MRTAQDTSEQIICSPRRGGYYNSEIPVFNWPLADYRPTPWISKFVMDAPRKTAETANLFAVTC